MTLIANHLDGAGCIVDRASTAADRLFDATRRASDSATDSAPDKVHAVRERASPALDRPGLG